MSKHLLTQRECQVLQLLATGASNQAIAAKLCISVKAVEGHLTNVYRKLKVVGRVGAVMAAISRGLVDHPCGDLRKVA